MEVYFSIFLMSFFTAGRTGFIPTTVKTVFMPHLCVKATLDCKHEFFGVSHWCPFVLALFSSLPVPPPLFALAPKVGATMHAGNVENCNAFQRDATEVQSNTITLS